MENNLINLHKNDLELIRFALVPSRLVFLDDVKIWGDFHKENGTTDLDYTIYELHKYFTKNILPKIQEYALSETQLVVLNLLRLHPAFKETDKGFLLSKIPVTYFNEQDIPQLNKHITMSPKINIAKGKINKPVLRKASVLEDSGEQNGSNDCRTVLLAQSNEEKSCASLLQSSGNKLSLVNACLFSVLLCKEEEIGQNIILPISEIYIRFYKCKQIFEDKAHLPNTFLTPIKTVLDYLKISQEIVNKLDNLGLYAEKFLRKNV